MTEDNDIGLIKWLILFVGELNLEGYFYVKWEKVSFLSDWGKRYQCNQMFKLVSRARSS